MKFVTTKKKRTISFTGIIVALGAGTVLFTALAGGKWAIIGLLVGVIAGLVGGYKLGKKERKEG